MKTTFLTLAISSIFMLFACNQNKDLKEVQKVQKAAKEANVEGTFVHSATVKISGPMAVYFHPDSAKLSRMEQSMGEQFFTKAEESMYDISTSRDYLIKQKVKVLETEARELHFQKDDGSVKVIDLSDPKFTWGLFLFNGKADPVQADMRKPEKQFDNYMKK